MALRFASAGVALSIGSRSRERAESVASELNARIGTGLISGIPNREMIPAAEIIFLTVPFEQGVAAVEDHRELFRPGSVLVDTTVPIKFEGGKAQFVDLPEGSASEALANRMPEGISLVGAFKTIPAHVLAEVSVPLECDAFVFGPSADAKARVIEALRSIPTLRPLDVGGLVAARTLERMTFLAISINRKYKVRSARFRVVGL